MERVIFVLVLFFSSCAFNNSSSFKNMDNDERSNAYKKHFEFISKDSALLSELQYMNLENSKPSPFVQCLGEAKIRVVEKLIKNYQKSNSNSELLQIANCYVAAKDDLKAMYYYDKLLGNKPNKLIQSVIYNNIAIFHATKLHFKPALFYLDKSLNLNRRSNVNIYNRLLVKFRLGMFNEIIATERSKSQFYKSEYVHQLIVLSAIFSDNLNLGLKHSSKLDDKFNESKLLILYTRNGTKNPESVIDEVEDLEMKSPFWFKTRDLLLKRLKKINEKNSKDKSS